MLRIPQIEEVRAHLLVLPALVTAVSRRDAGCVEAAVTWLERAEAILVANRLTGAAAIAMARLILRDAEHGVHPSAVSVPAGATKRVVRLACASEALRRGEQALSRALQDDQVRVEEGFRLARQILAVAVAKGLLTPDRSDWSANARAMMSDPDLAPALVRMRGLLGPQDTVLALDVVSTQDSLVL